MQFDFTYIGSDPAAQRETIPMLARCFDEWQYFIRRYGEVFPFLELSFVARESSSGEYAGHVGLMPFEVSDGKGAVIKMAGAASVATDPAFRNRKIAARLCTMAAAWAQENGFAFLPLYTALFRVYRSCGWECYHDRVLRLQNISCGGNAQWRAGEKLTPAEREQIREFYEASADFPGKVTRLGAGTFHSWERMFNETFLQWHLTPHGYAVRQENTLAELCTLPGYAAEAAAGCSDTFLAPEHPAAAELQSSGFAVYAPGAPVPDIRHGECVMINPDNNTMPDLFFPLTDKF